MKQGAAVWTLDVNVAVDRTQDGTLTFRRAVTDSMNSHGPAMVTGGYGISNERWHYQDTVLGCVDHDLAVAAQQILTDTVSTTCQPDQTLSAAYPPIRPSSN